MAEQDQTKADLPDEAAIIEFINSCPTPPSPRDIARAFKLPADQRAPLRRMLREMAETGKIDRREGRRVATPDQLPEVTVLELVSFDDNGDGLARPAAGYDGDLPEIRVILSRKAGRAPAIGQTILARLARTGPAHYEARIIRVLERQQQRLFGVVETAAKGLMLVPAERGKRHPVSLQSFTDLPCNAGDLVEAEMVSSRGYLGKTARAIRNLGPVDQKGAFSALALAEFGIRHVFPEPVLAESRGLKVPPAKVAAICVTCHWSQLTAPMPVISTMLSSPNQWIMVAGGCWWQLPMLPIMCVQVPHSIKRRAFVATQSICQIW